MSIRMNRVGAALVLATLESAALAQGGPPSNGVTVFGVIDTGVEYLDKVGASGASLTRVPTNTAYSPSRLGFRGSEDLGHGLRAVFTLESQIGIDSGTFLNGARAFGRQAWVGLAGPWGTVSIGRQNTMLFWGLLDATVMGPNVYGTGSLDSYLPNARADNAVAWRGTFGPLTAGAMFSLGRDSVNAGPSPAGMNCAGENAADDSACREWSVLVKYDTGPWGAVFAVDHLSGGPGAFGGLVRSDFRDQRTMINGWLKTGSWKLGAGLIRRTNDGNPVTPRSDLFFAGASLRATPAWVLEAEAMRLDFKDSDNAATLLALRATYNLSSRSAAFVTAGHIDNRGSLALSVSGGAPNSGPAPGGSQNGLLVGIRHVF